MLIAGFFLGLLFNPEDGSSMFLQNIGELLPDYAALHSRRFLYGIQFVVSGVCMYFGVIIGLFRHKFHSHVVFCVV
jgi:hypothetical protein